jgi:hypothetical protein
MGGFFTVFYSLQIECLVPPDYFSQMVIEFNLKLKSSTGICLVFHLAFTRPKFLLPVIFARCVIECYGFENLPRMLLYHDTTLKERES